MKVALQLNAIVGLASALVSGAIMSLVLTRPETIASAVAQRENREGDVVDCFMACLDELSDD